MATFCHDACRWATRSGHPGKQPQLTSCFGSQGDSVTTSETQLAVRVRRLRCRHQILKSPFRLHKHQRIGAGRARVESAETESTANDRDRETKPRRN